MTGAAPNPAGGVDQILFSWSERLLIGGSGLGPVATSLDMDGLRAWNERLAGGDAVVGQWYHGAADCVALGALRLGRGGDQGAVLRMLPARDPNGRGSQLVHALVGPAAVVNARLALGLHGWTGWITPEQVPALSGELPELDAGELWAEAGAGLDALAVPPEPLAGLLAGALAAPADQYLAAIAPEDLGLVAGLVRRLEGVAGDAPWTMMLGAKVAGAKLQPRLLVLGLGDARRGRVPLTTAATGDARLDRAGGLLAALPPASLTPPQKPLATSEALLEWVESEHQRANKVLDLIDRALAGTLDDDARLYLDGPSGQERLWAELRQTGTAELADRLYRWADRRPSRLVDAGRTLCAIAAERYLTEAGAGRQTPEHLADAVRLMGTTAAEASGVLANWFGGLAKVTRTHRSAAVIFAASLNVDLVADRTVKAALRGMPPDDVLNWVAQLAAKGETRAARYFMRTAYDEWRLSRDRAGDENVRARLLRTGTFHETIHRLVTLGDATAGEEAELYQIVLHLAYGSPIDDLGPVLKALPTDAAATDYRPWLAVAAVVEQRDLVFQVAAHLYSRNAPEAVLEEMLEHFSTADLIEGVAGRPQQPGLLGTVYSLLATRRHGVDERSQNRRALLENRFLTEMVESVWQTTPEHRLKTYALFINAAYKAGDRAAEAGAGLSVAGVRELLAMNGPPLFVWAVLHAAAEDAVLPVLLDETRRQAAELGISDELVQRITRAPHHAVEIREVEVRAPRLSEHDHTGRHAPVYAPSAYDPQHQGGPGYAAPRRNPQDAPPIDRHARMDPGSHSAHEPDQHGKPELSQGDRDALRAFLTGRNRNGLISMGIVVLALVLLLSVLVFDPGSGDAPPARVTPTVTVTTTVAPSEAPTTGQNP